MINRHLDQQFVSRPQYTLDTLCNPYQLNKSNKKVFSSKSPHRLTRKHSPAKLSPNKLQGRRKDSNSLRKPSLKKGLFQQEIQKQNKQNISYLCNTSSTRTLSTKADNCNGTVRTFRQASSISKGKLPNRNNSITRNRQERPSVYAYQGDPQTTNYNKGQKLSFKNIRMDMQGQMHKKTKKHTHYKSTVQPDTEYQLHLPVVYSANPTPQISESLIKKSCLTEGQKLSKQKIASNQSLRMREHQLTFTSKQVKASMDSDDDKVNMSGSEQQNDFDMSPFLN